jgi:uncharacterized protein (DUF488 family)
MILYTIGFTKTTAQNFFDRLNRSGAKKLVDVRLNNVSQLAGFAKRDDLAYFTRELSHIPYEHCPELAPTQHLLDSYKKLKGSWSDYARDFLNLMKARQIERLDADRLDGACLLCSEDKPHNCHRKLVAEYLKEHWGDVEIRHL